LTLKFKILVVFGHLMDQP